MSVPQYEFCKENKLLLIKFVKKAEENKSNVFCNHQKYNELSKFLPLINAELLEAEDLSVIDITESDEENIETVPIQSQLQEDDELEEMLEQTVQNMNETTFDDIIYAIKENLETDNILSTPVISNLHKSVVDLHNIFSYLSGILNLEEVLRFGSSLKSEVVNNDIILCYVRHLLLKKLSEEFSEQLQSTFNEFCKKYPNILKDEISNILINNESFSKAFLQFLDGLADEFKSNIFKNFILKCEVLQFHHISFIDILLNSQVEIDSLSKLIEITSPTADKYASEKSFGKLLIKVLRLLGKNVAVLEKPLNRIIGSHRSVWKSKMQKIFDENFEDNSMMMTQSFRF